MPVDYELDHGSRVVRSRTWGDVTEDDIARLQLGIQNLFRDGILDAAWAHVADFTGTTSVADLSAAAIQRRAHSNPWPPGSCRVLIAPSTVVYGLARMFQILSADENERFIVVHSAAEAHTWLLQARRPSTDAGTRPDGGHESKRADT